MAQEKEPLDLFGRRKSFRPTGESVLEILDTVQIVHMEQNGSMIRLFPENRRPQIKRILDLLGMSTAIYTLSMTHMVTLAETFLSGGTYFNHPLEQVLSIIEESRFKCADVVFVTDGEAHLNESFIAKFNTKKGEKSFNVLSLLLGVERTVTVEQFSDEFVKAKDFSDETSYVVLGI